ncbi:MAG TPA: PF20097 family protein [Allosphingosinicella sp.]|nr:PF20097 family protein [Allosphingosinicella sp.]
MSESKNCPRCGGAMEEGFMVDGTHGGSRVARWTAGRPRKSLWTGIKLSGAKLVEIATWRCRRCGLLESYAPEG